MKLGIWTELITLHTYVKFKSNTYQGSRDIQRNKSGRDGTGRDVTRRDATGRDKVIPI